MAWRFLPALVAFDDCIWHVLRTRHFLLANRSAILLKHNGIMSSTKRIKHINVTDYFVKSKINSGEVIVQWYSSEKVVGNFFSKSLIGSKFMRLRRKTMNYEKIFGVPYAGIRDLRKKVKTQRNKKWLW